MGKHWIKFKVWKVISTLKSCRSKDPSSLPSNPVPSSFLRLSIATNPTHKPHIFSLKRHVSSALISARRSFSRPRPSQHDSSRTRSPLSSTSSSSSRFRWQKQGKWHVMAKIPDDFNFPQNYDSTPPRQKIYNSAASDDELNQNDVVLFPPLPTKHQKRRRIPPRRRKIFPNFRLSTSSDSGLFSDDSEETDTLISTSPSAARHPDLAEIPPSSAPARLSEFMRKMLPSKAEEEVVEGKVRESYAVVKRSEDPYKDFRRSMAEMVMEKEMFERKDLEELLRCFLELNSEHLHGIIVRAFVDIWEALFVGTSSSSGIRCRQPVAYFTKYSRNLGKEMSSKCFV